MRDKAEILDENARALLTGILRNEEYTRYGNDSLVPVEDRYVFAVKDAYAVAHLMQAESKRRSGVVTTTGEFDEGVEPHMRVVVWDGKRWGSGMRLIDNMDAVNLRDLAADLADDARLAIERDNP